MRRRRAGPAWGGRPAREPARVRRKARSTGGAPASRGPEILPRPGPSARAGAGPGGRGGRLVTHTVIHGGDSPREDQARWAADEAVRRYGDVAVCLAGYGAGGLAALRAAGHEAVNSVLAMAPCLEGRPRRTPLNR